MSDFLVKSKINTGGNRILDNFVSPVTATVVERLGSDGNLVRNTSNEAREMAILKKLWGFKPTYGAISRAGMIPRVSSVDTVGVLAKSADELATILKKIAGKDELDSTSLPENVFERTVKPIEKISDVELPNAEYAEAAFMVIEAAEIMSNFMRLDGVRYGERASDESLTDLYEQSRTQGLPGEIKEKIMLGNFVLSKNNYDKYFLQAAKVRTLVVNGFKTIFEKYDAIKDNGSLTLAASLAGLPEVTLPSGDSFIGRWQEDAALLDFAKKMGDK